MAYRITVTDKYKSRNAVYIADIPSSETHIEITQEDMYVRNSSRTADLFTLSILDLNNLDEYRRIRNDPEKLENAYSIYFEEPWLFFHCTVDQMMRCCVDYLKEGNWDFPEIYNNKLTDLPLTQMVTLCYPLHVPQKPIIERQKTFKILRAAAPLILADMFGLDSKDVEVYPINKRFNPDHWSWEMHQARRLAKGEGITLDEKFP